MSLIKCPECGKEVSDAASSCPSCGFKFKKKFDLKKKYIFIPLIIGCFGITVISVMGLSFFALFIKTSNSPANRAIRILENDYEKEISVKYVLYNEEVNGCIIEFTDKYYGVTDTACVHLDDKSIGYKSVFLYLSDEMKKEYISDEERKEYALLVIEYPYEALWVFSATQSRDEWKVVR